MKKLIQTLTIAVSLLFAGWSFAAEPVNVNTASAQEIATAIKGVGERKAAAIIEYREQHGAFQTVDDLLKVRGIGPKILEQNRDNIVISTKQAKLNAGDKATQ